jgi:hypothetical protein
VECQVKFIRDDGSRHRGRRRWYVRRGHAARRGRFTLSEHGGSDAAGLLSSVVLRRIMFDQLVVLGVQLLVQGVKHRQPL